MTSENNASPLKGHMPLLRNLFFQIADCAVLRRDTLEIRHIEILFPADHMIVRAAIGDIDAAASGGKGHSGKLPFQLGVHITIIILQYDACESLRRRHQLQKFRSSGRHRQFSRLFCRCVKTGITLCQLTEPNSRNLLPRRRHFLRIQIRQHRQRQTVRITKRSPVKSQVSSPAQIISQIPHQTFRFHLFSS